MSDEQRREFKQEALDEISQVSEQIKALYENKIKQAQRDGSPLKYKTFVTIVFFTMLPWLVEKGWNAWDERALRKEQETTLIKTMEATQKVNAEALQEITTWMKNVNERLEKLESNDTRSSNQKR